jgi:thiol:disulfide interchange protein DsbD
MYIYNFVSLQAEKFNKTYYIIMKQLFLALSLLFFFQPSEAQFPSMSDMDPVTWSFQSENVGEGLFDLYISAEIEDPWHMYALEQERTGPIPTTINFEEGNDYTLVGDIEELTDPVIKFDEGFQFDVGAYYKEAKFKQRVRIAGSKEVEIPGFIEYQCCDDETCLPPFEKEFKFRVEGVADTETTDEVVIPADEGEIRAEEAPVLEEADEDAVEEEITDEPDEMIQQYEEGEEAGEIIDATLGEEEGDSMLGFLILTFLLGLAAILTPCVYPMIPMTISFFMRENQNKAIVILKGLIFGFSIILVYTGLGALVALTGLDANFGNMISAHWIPNIIFFILFVIFALSFLGMFEIVLPSGLVNKVDKQADRGGFLGSFFMGITLVVVSFSCTGPIVGSLLAEAAGGDVMKPILGMFFFSLAFALPFTLLAIFPFMLKNLPKSGGWLNSVKVVLGFLMLAFGMKFLSSIDQAYHLDIFSREVYISIWFILTVFTGLYLLGKIRLPHDTEMPFIKIPRLLLAVASFVFAMYLFTGIFGANLTAISALLPPKSSQNFDITGTQVAGVVSDDQSETFCGPGKHDELFELPHGIKGYFSYEDGVKCAIEKNKPIFLDFTGHFCSNCKQMENQVWTDPEVLQRLKEEYVVISLYTDDKTKLPEEEWITTEEGEVLKTIGKQNVYFELQQFKTFATPWYVLMDAEGNLLTEPRGKDLDVESYLEFLDEGLDNFYK